MLLRSHKTLSCCHDRILTVHSSCNTAKSFGKFNFRENRWNAACVTFHLHWNETNNAHYFWCQFHENSFSLVYCKLHSTRLLCWQKSASFFNFIANWRQTTKRYRQIGWLFKSPLICVDCNHHQFISMLLSINVSVWPSEFNSIWIRLIDRSQSNANKFDELRMNKLFAVAYQNQNLVLTKRICSHDIQTSLAHFMIYDRFRCHGLSYTGFHVKWMRTPSAEGEMCDLSISNTVWNACGMCFWCAVVFPLRLSGEMCLWFPFIKGAFLHCKRFHLTTNFPWWIFP